MSRFRCSYLCCTWGTLLWSSRPVSECHGFVSVSVLLHHCLETGCQIHISKGGKPCHSHLLWFRSPHILIYILTHPASAAAAAAAAAPLPLSLWVFFAQRPPKSNFPPHHTRFTWNPAFLGKGGGGCAALFFLGLFLRVKPFWEQVFFFLTRFKL